MEEKSVHAFLDAECDGSVEGISIRVGVGVVEDVVKGNGVADGDGEVEAEVWDDKAAANHVLHPEVDEGDDERGGLCVCNESSDAGADGFEARRGVGTGPLGEEVYPVSGLEGVDDVVHVGLVYPSSTGEGEDAAPGEDLCDDRVEEAPVCRTHRPPQLVGVPQPRPGDGSSNRKGVVKDRDVVGHRDHPARRSPRLLHLLHKRIAPIHCRRREDLQKQPREPSQHPYHHLFHRRGLHIPSVPCFHPSPIANPQPSVPFTASVFHDAMMASAMTLVSSVMVSSVDG